MRPRETGDRIGRATANMTRSSSPVGDADLWQGVRQLRPRVHCFGHVHDSSGLEERDGTVFVNAAVCDRQFWPTNPVRVVDL